MARKPPQQQDIKTCLTCDSYKAIDFDCGECRLMPPQWISDEETSGWAMPTTAADSTCRFWLRRLNS